MNIRILNKLLFAFFIILIIFQFPSCKKKQTEEFQDINAKVIFTSGDVFIISEAGIVPAVIGAILKPGDSVRTAADSYLELSLNDASVVRLDQSTELSISKLAQGKNGYNTTLTLAAGAIINKVEKIIGDEDYIIKTKSAAFGVRGTEFLVESKADGTDILAVKSGNVRMLPHFDTVNRIKENELPRNISVDNFVNIFNESFPVVSEGSEITITPAFSENILASLVNVENAISEQRSGEISINDLNTIISQSILNAQTEAAGSLALVTQIGAENLEMLKVADTMQVSYSGEVLKDILIQTDPSGARIYFDNSFIGFGSVSALLNQERTLFITVEEDGYEPFEQEIAVADINEKPYVIKLEPKKPELGYLEISTSPSDAQVFINGNLSGRGMFTGSYEPGAQINVAVRRNEYASQEFSAAINQGETLRRNITLAPLLMPYNFATGYSSADNIFPAGGNFYAVSSGTNNFSILNNAGEVVFSTANASSQPVFASGQIFYVSGTNLEAVNSSNWNTGGSVSLESASMQTPVIYNNTIYINSGNSILKIAPAGMNIERQIAVPDKSVSKPYLYNDNILTVTDKGVLHIIGASDTPLSSIGVTMGSPSAVAIAAQGRTGYFASSTGFLSAVNLDSGEYLWSQQFQSTSPDEIPQLYVSGNSVALFVSGNLFVYNSSGNRITQVSNINCVTPGENNIIYAASSDGKITAYNSAAGTPGKSAAIDAVLSGIMFKDGKIHASSESGRYIVINTAAFK